MRILHVSEYRLGNGAAVAAHRLMVALAERGLQVEKIYIYPGGDKTASAFPENCIEEDGGAFQKLRDRVRFRLHERLSMSRFPPLAEWSARRLLSPFYRKNARAIQHDATQGGFDAIHFHNVSLMLGHEDIARLSREFPIVWSMHDCHAAHGYAYRYAIDGGAVRTDPPTRLLRSIRTPRRWYRRAGTIALVSPSCWLAEEAPLHGPPVSVIPYGVPGGDFFPIAQAEARAAMGIPADGRLKVLAIAGDLRHPRKNFAVVADCMKSLRNEPVDFLCLGNADEEFRRAHPGATFLGFASTSERLRQAYSAADVTVVPSLIDNLPNTAIESLLCGTPVAGSNAGGIPDIVIPGETGWLFDPRNSEQLAAILKRLSGHPAEHRTLAGGCADTAAARYGSGLQADRMVALYADLIARHQRAGLPPSGQGQ